MKQIREKAGALPKVSMIFTTALILVLSVPMPGAAFDWMKKGQELLGGATSPTAPAGLSNETIAAGLREALQVGSERVVGRLGTYNGFNADPNVHIPLPGSLERVRTGLKAVGMSGMLDDLEVQLNRAAEIATPKAKALFMEAIEDMTLEDVMGIYNGAPDAATRYFQGKMSPPLAEEMTPLVSESLAEVGAVQTYDAVMGKYRTLPFVPDVKTDLTGYVVEQGMAGIFYYLGQEEAAIRENPAKRTTELLRKVFGGK